MRHPFTNNTIDTGDAPPVRKPFYRQSPQVMEEMNKQLDALLKHGIIEESDSEYQSPVVMVKKKGGELRFCVDYRMLNKQTKPKYFPLPRLNDVFDSLGKANAKIFSSLDLMHGYWQVGMDKNTAHKSAFVTPSGVYQWCRMPFGLVSAPGSFQLLLTKVFRGLTYQIALVYVDGVLIYSQSFEQHLKHLELIFDRLRKANLKLKPSKCKFALPEVTYLGHRISKDGVKVDISKTEVVRTFPIPKNQKQLRSFLGLTNYYRRFIKNYSHICSPLNRLLRNDIKFDWTQKCNNAFTYLKEAMTSPPVLAYPDLKKPFILTTDASGTALGYILGQRDNMGKERVIAYGGRSLNEAERKWGISELECLAVLEGIKAYHVYLANNHFKIYTDHRALTWLSNIKQSTGRLARWSVLLQGYDFEICYRKGVTMKNADALSRREYPPQPNEVSDPEDNIPSVNLNMIHTPEEAEFIETTLIYSEYPVPPQISVNDLSTVDPGDDIISDDIDKLQKECPDFKDMYKYLDTGSLPEDQSKHSKILSEAEHYVLHDHVLYHFYQPRSKGKKYDERFIKQLACPRSLRKDLIVAYHELGHLGFDRTYRAMQLKYYFPNMYQTVADFIRSCDSCQRAKVSTHPTKVPLTSMPIMDTFSKWHIDIIGPFKKTTEEGYKYILVIVDSFSKWPEAFPLKTQDSGEIAKILYKEIFTRYGAPHYLVSD